jgi:hypothetical protein
VQLGVQLPHRGRGEVDLQVRRDLVAHRDHA